MRAVTSAMVLNMLKTFAVRAPRMAIKKRSPRERGASAIGFGMMEDIDKGGQGGIIVDMRVARTWRDAGIYEMMYEHLIDFAKKEEDIKYIRTSVNKFPEGTDVKEICKVEYIAFEGDVETLRETLKSVPTMEELPLSSVVDFKQRHKRLMLRPGVGENILTKGFFFADGDTYTLCKDNLYEVDEDSCVFVDNNKPIQSISFGSDVETDRAALYTIERGESAIESADSAARAPTARRERYARRHLGDAFEHAQNLRRESAEDGDQKTSAESAVSERGERRESAVRAPKIGFGMMEDIDKGGQGGIIVDMRVARTWRDAGIYEMMYEHLIDFAKKEEDIKYIRTSVNKFPEGTDVKEICKVEYIAFEGDVETLRETLKSVPAMEELPLSSVVDFKQRHKRLMLRPGVGENILTKGFFFADGDTYTLCKDNLYEVDEDSCVFVDNNKPIQSISFGSDVETDRAALYTIEVNTKNIELMKSHILKQMQSACVVAEGQIVFSVLTLGFEDEIRAFLKGIEGLEEAEQYKESVVWSKILLHSD
ncbi:Hypp8455 [Branchiostoma lanceolatum]|uniref:Hypp8455 protein n=1 Tax=Branchiostoma lanceolatum TaxID=7740 RepID=A0A8J9Z6U8_BRALA|nr:Hypp8455 [Branchiostoma lanceolatum]